MDPRSTSGLPGPSSVLALVSQACCPAVLARRPPRYHPSRCILVACPLACAVRAARMGAPVKQSVHPLFSLVHMRPTHGPHSTGRRRRPVETIKQRGRSVFRQRRLCDGIQCSRARLALEVERPFPYRSPLFVRFKKLLAYTIDTVERINCRQWAITSSLVCGILCALSPVPLGWYVAWP